LRCELWLTKFNIFAILCWYLVQFLPLLPWRRWRDHHEHTVSTPEPAGEYKREIFSSN